MESIEVDLRRVIREDRANRLEKVLQTLDSGRIKKRVRIMNERGDGAVDILEMPTANECGLKPLGTKVVLKVDEDPTETEGGIALPEDYKHGQLVKATVIQVGFGTKNEKLILQVGMRVITNRHAGNKITHLGVDYLVAEQSNIIAIITKE